MVAMAAMFQHGAPSEKMKPLIQAAVDGMVESLIEDAIELVALTQGPDGDIVARHVPKEDIGDFVKTLIAATKRNERATLEAVNSIA